MNISRDDVVWAYRMFLSREPESELAIESHLLHHNREHLRQAMLTSPEFAQKTKLPAQRTEADRMYDGLAYDDEELMRRYLLVSEPEQGFVKNFIGTRMRTRYVHGLEVMSGHCYNDIPSVVGDYHAEAIEYVGLLRALEAGSGPFVAVELGAGWGSWSISAGHMARRLGRTSIRLYAVEGASQKMPNVLQHFTDNGFPPEEHVIVNAAVGPIDGYALFTFLDPIKEYGAEATFVEGGERPEEREGYEIVRSITLKTLLADEPLVDLIHFDVQGAEREVAVQSIDVLNEKVRYVIIGTHSRSIEGALVDLFLANGWKLVNEQPARICPSPAGAEAIRVDGTQVWRNPRII